MIDRPGAVEGERPLRIVFLSHTPREGTFRVGSHHLSRELAAAGHEVVHISTPVSVLHRIVRRVTPERAAASRRGVVRARDGVVDYVPRTLLPANIIWTRRQLRRILNDAGIADFDIVFVDQPLLEHPDLGRGIYIFRPTDLFERSSVRARLPRLLKNTQGIAATSPGVLAALGGADLACTVIENGVEYELFQLSARPRCGFVYVGAVDFRFDVDAVIRIAQAHPAEPVSVYGPISTRIPAPSRLPKNLRFCGKLPYRRMPEVTCGAKVGLLAFRDIDRNTTRSPMKLYEYLASGLNVLAPSHAAPRLGVAEGVFTYEHENIGVAASRALLAPTPNTVGQRIAQAQDWSIKARELLAFAMRCDT